MPIRLFIIRLVHLQIFDLNFGVRIKAIYSILNIVNFSDQNCMNITPLTYKRILLTTDFSKVSSRAVAHAISIAKKYRSKLYIIHVLEPILSPVEYTWAGVQMDDIESNRLSFAEKNLLDWCAEHLPEDFDTRLIVRQGLAVTEILAAAQENEIDLIIMATHGHTGLAHVFFGSTAERVLKKSELPVMTVR